MSSYFFVPREPHIRERGVGEHLAPVFGVITYRNKEFVALRIDLVEHALLLFGERVERIHEHRLAFEKRHPF